MFGKTATRTVTITHSGGLHARPSLAVAQTARMFKARILLSNGRQSVEASEVLQLLTLGAPCGTELTLQAKGVDAEAAADAMVDLFARNFGIDDEH